MDPLWFWGLLDPMRIDSRLSRGAGSCPRFRRAWPATWRSCEGHRVDNEKRAKRQALGLFMKVLERENSAKEQPFGLFMKVFGHQQYTKQCSKSYHIHCGFWGLLPLTIESSTLRHQRVVISWETDHNS